ncbi:succinate dehydrogenase/fumarate reductase iron-sulfur subunit [Actinomyces bovis]|uniref:Succinate dehydrogenase/fumarate reductase iron-sulfur subunit n=1 Tax=Actinomyces bovis TaxID=1658 RepID=A0ABY1VR14_9ACTO|nr:(Fe-S)-binding protein [Actinomyces bovis]SPT55052.1 succinate dehydrogenase/fumarate reductase iron-sulfur subunit [Actinomyces bovis]VEG56219.1 succinate dehydrogenase/fumarate reductase iron-sulfur subunit [Actinomyces israelii]
MTPLAVVQLVCALITAALSVVGVGLFARAALTIANRVRVGRPVPRERLSPVARRLWHTLSTVLSHQAFKGRPWIRAAHWLVMVSFPLLFLTLVTGYGQVLAGPDWHLPWLDRQPWWTWTVEFIAWLSLAGIIALTVVRIRLTRRGATQAPYAPDSDAGRRTRTSRFTGSTASQARFVEAVVGGVVACVLVLRMLEHARLVLAGNPADLSNTPSWLLHPLTAWATPLLTPLGPDGLAIAITITATVKIAISMVWMVVVGLQPSMGVAWHRFLALLTVYAGRNLDGTKALGPLEPISLPSGKSLTLETLDELDEALEAAEEGTGPEPQLGVGRIDGFTWKGLLDFSTCTECGRCQDLCPAWNTGKPLSPKLFTLALRDHHAAAAPWLRAAATLGADVDSLTQEQLDARRPNLLGRLTGTQDGLATNTSLGLAPGSAHTADVLGALLEAKAAPTEQGVARRPAELIGEVIPPEVLWSCTTCGACVDQCPVDIEHIDRVVDLRRQQVLMASAFPKELGQMFRKLESKGNPWGLPARKRLEWAKNLDFEVPVIGVDVEDATGVDYLLWVGCAGAYEDRAKKTTRALAELLHTAGVSFAVLGDGETCTGDPARRAGNEILFQTLAAQNVETLNEVGAKRIVVSCAHCFNTIAREYPQIGGNYEVLHYTQLLNTLVRDGRLRPVPPASKSHPAASPAQAANSTPSDAEGDHTPPPTEATPSSPQNSVPQTVTYQDACYLGRHNQVYSPPRELIEATGAQTVEMPRNRERGFCCGGGGARAFMEESIGTRIAVERSREAIGTGAQVVATACPFCTAMLSDGVASEGAQVRVTDVATLMLEAVKRGQN